MKVLTFIPTLNAEEFISDQIRMLKKQSIKTDIFIVDSGSEDNTLQILQKEKINYKEILKTEFNHALTRNEVLKYKDYDYYLFLTQDAVPCNEFMIENMLKKFNNDMVKIVYSRQIPYSFSDDIERFAREYNYPKQNIIKTFNNIKKMGIKTFFTSNSCCMYDAKYFQRKKGFNKTNVSEDMEFAYRCIMDGYAVVYAADSTVCHSHVYSLKDLYKRYFEIGKFFCYHKNIYKYLNIQDGGEQTKYIFKRLLEKKAFLSIFKLFIQVFIKYVAFKKGQKGC